MRIESKNLTLEGNVLNNAARDHSWWDKGVTKSARRLSNEQVMLIKALIKYADWSLSQIKAILKLECSVQPLATISNGLCYRDVILHHSRIPDEFYSLTGMEKTKSGPKGRCKSAGELLDVPRPKSGPRSKMSLSEAAACRELYQMGFPARVICSVLGRTLHPITSCLQKESFPFFVHKEEDLPEDFPNMVKSAKAMVA